MTTKVDKPENEETKEKTEEIEHKPGESFEDCEKHCVESIACDAWTFNKKNKICYLKDAQMSTSLSKTWNIDLVSVRMESCTYQVDFCSIVMDGEILVEDSNSKYMNQASIGTEMLKNGTIREICQWAAPLPLQN